MQGYSVLKTVFDFLIDTGLLSRVYHSVEIIEEKGVRYPAFPSGKSELYYVGLDDTKEMTCYIRQIEDLKVLKINRVSSSVNEYECSIAHRAVFFNKNETRNQDDLLQSFIQFSFLPGIKLNRVIIDKDKLMQLETRPKAFEVVANDILYFAVDFEALIKLQRNTCKLEIKCADISNPYTKQTWRVHWDYFTEVPEDLNAAVLTRYKDFEQLKIYLPVKGLGIDKYLVIRMPQYFEGFSEWYNNQMNYGTIPDQLFLPVSTSNGWNYIVSRVGITLDESSPLIIQ